MTCLLTRTAPLMMCQAASMHKHQERMDWWDDVNTKSTRQFQTCDSRRSEAKQDACLLQHKKYARTEEVCMLECRMRGGFQPEAAKMPAPAAPAPRLERERAAAAESLELGKTGSSGEASPGLGMAPGLGRSDLLGAILSSL